MIHRRNALGAGVALTFAPMLPNSSFAASSLHALTSNDFRRSGQRGVGFGMLRFGPHSVGDNDALVAIGAGHVRMFIEAERDGETYRIAPKQLTSLDATLENLKQRGIYMVLTATFGADARFTGLWNSGKLQDGVVQLWAQLANHLKGDSGIAGFDIVNEPVPPGKTFADREDRWLELAARVVDAIRKIDPWRIVIVESAPDATPESFDNMRVLPFDNLVYSVHSYRPMEFTHQTVMREYATPQRYPDGEINGKPASLILKESLDHVKRFTDKYDVPIYVGEFSAVRWAPDGSAARYVGDSIALFEQYGWSWSYHEFRSWSGWDPEMDSPVRDAVPRRNGTALMTALHAGLGAPRR